MKSKNPRTKIWGAVVALAVFVWTAIAHGHADPVFIIALYLEDGRIRGTEEIDVQVLLDDEGQAAFAAAATEAELAPIVDELRSIYDAAIVVEIDGQPVALERTVKVITVAPEDDTAELTYHAVGLYDQAAPEGAIELRIRLADDSPGSAVARVQDANGGQIGRALVVFPGETSRSVKMPLPEPELAMNGQELALAPENDPFDPAASALPAPPKSTAFYFWDLIRLGFRHIIPDGLDHILFVVGLFFFSARLRPLLTQVTIFTLAHSLTLALSTLGYYRMPGSIAEPLIAASIVLVGLENAFRKDDEEHSSIGLMRMLVVFVFGLIHGLGIANMLAKQDLGDQIFVPLLGFNIGVEFGQIAVVAICFALFGVFLRRDFYRRCIAIPISLIIAGIGAWWTFERLFLGG